MPFSNEDLAKLHATVVRSIEEQDVAAFASLYTEDGALLLPDGSVLSGRPAIAEAFGDWLAAGFVRQEVEVLGLYSDGDLAVEEGRAAGTFKTDTGYVIRSSNYIIVHRRGADGQWLMHRDIWTSVGETSGGGY
ncbi:YybH family protein [Rhodococcus wratislaviensis]|uniref:YybH family protein n=1 Tax=Rhodococcus wratislaviensis TaxID=44752 RepID=UPI00364A7250